MIKIEVKDVRLVPVGEIKRNPKNRNKHPKEQIEELARHYEVHGMRTPIIVSNQSGQIVAGDGRFQAAMKAGMKEVPVTYQDFDSPEKEFAFGVADNGLALWSELDLEGINLDAADLPLDFNLNDLGIKDFKLVETEVLEPGCDEDAVPEHVEPKTKPGDLYKLGNHRLLCGDSTNIQHVERLMDGNVAELCFTSPPYADQREYNGGKELSTEHLAKFISTAYGKAKYFAVNLGYSRKSGEVNQYWDDYIKEAKACGLRFLSWNIWNRAGFGYTIGQATAMFTIDHEWVFVFGSEPKELNRTVENKQASVTKKSTIRNSDGSTRPTHGTVGSVRQLGTVFTSDIARYTGDAHHKHPAMFPVIFPESYIEAMTDPGEHVLEPFGGSGTTLIACHKAGRNCHIMELDPKYCDLIIARFEKYSGQKAELISG